MEIVFSLVYISSASELFSSVELESLLDRSRRQNLARDITGMLLYKDGNFMQFLEGPKADVLALMNKIRADKRHHGLIVLLQEEHSRREFEGWAMGFKNIRSDSTNEFPGYSEFLDLPANSEQLARNPSKTLRLLIDFRKCMR